MRVLAGDWPLGELAWVRGGEVVVSGKFLKKTRIGLSEIAEIESISDATIAGQPPDVRASASLALGRKNRGQIVLITLTDGRLLLLECTLRDVQALLNLSARMNVSRHPSVEQGAALAGEREHATAKGEALAVQGFHKPAEYPSNYSLFAQLSVGEPSEGSDSNPKNKAKLPLKTWLALGGFIVVGGCVILLGSVGENTRTAPTAMLNAPTSNQTTGTPPAPANKNAKLEQLSQRAAEKSFASTRRTLLNLAKPCNVALSAFGRPQSAYQGYNNAIRAETICSKTASDLTDLKFQPPIPDDARQEFDTIGECYGHAYLGRVYALDEAKKIFDSDPRPSAIAGFQSDMQEASAETQACTAKFVSLEIKYGFVEEPLKEILGKRSKNSLAGVDHQLQRRQASSK